MIRILPLALALLVAPLRAQEPQVLATLHDFESPADAAVWKADGTRVEATSQNALSSKGALKITFSPGVEWPKAQVKPTQPLDWSKAGALAFDAFNVGASAIALGVRVDDDVAADGNTHCRTGNTTLAPGEKSTLVMPLLKVAPMDFGMRGLPPTPASRAGRDIGAGGSGPFDTGHIVAYQVFTHAPVTPQVLVIDNVRLLPDSAPNMDGIADRFGQFTRGDWPGKLKDEAEFATRKADEEKSLRARPQLANRDRFGGWSTGPKLRASGFFRSEKRGGKWWLVDPDGRLFFSTGVDSMNAGEAMTMISGREKMFTWLPPEESEWKSHWAQRSGVHSGPVKEGRTFSFYGANLQRKDGANWQAAWFERSLRRLPSWGFNTLGNWADWKLFEQKAKVPYTVALGVGGSHARLSSGDDYWGSHHDPFDPQFERDARAGFARSISDAMRDDPFCLGYFVDNELAWGGGSTPKQHFGLAYGALNLEAAHSPAKAFFVARLREKYASIDKLNAAWNTELASWQVLEAPYRASDKPSAAMQADLSMFVLEHARKYFSVLKSALQSRDPNHLYLGARFAWRTEEAVQAADEICDVVSFNIYKPALDKEWDFTRKMSKPCIIGEFHFGALDRGMFHTGLVSVASQQARAAQYEKYLHSVLDQPAFVGAHWFQYIDEPLSGRWFDGENYNIGFVDATDTPYPEMVEAARRVHGAIYERRARQTVAARP